MPNSSRYLNLMLIATHSARLSRAARLGLTLLLLAVPAAIGAGNALASPSTYDGISADGKIAIFSTKDQMVPGDTDHEEDVYERTFDSSLGEYVTREVSIGPRGGNDTLPARYDGISSDGSEVFFSTKERLVPADTDLREDVYVRNLAENRTILASEGNGDFDAGFVPGGVPAEGGEVFFATAEKLSAADKDESLDIYVRDIAAETTTLVSAGAASCALSGCGNGPEAAQFRGTDALGDKAFFTSFESLDAADVDTSVDIYERDLTAGTTSLVSVAKTCPSDLPPGQSCDPSFGGSSPDGSHVFFETNERLSEADTDSSQDVYDWSGSGMPALASTAPGTGNGHPNVTFSGSSADGAAVYFQTSERLLPAADEDQFQDVYRRMGGVTTLVSAAEAGHSDEEIPATFRWVPPVGPPNVVVFTTIEALSNEDGDAAQDVYMRSGGETTLLSTGAEASGGEFDAAFAGASDDGSRVFFITAESLSKEDTDSSPDIYVHSPTGTSLVSTGSIGGNGANSAGLHGVSADGSLAFFVTQERLAVDDDFAAEDDVYMWSPARTLLVSVQNSSGLVLGPPPPSLERTSPGSPDASTTPAIIGQAASEALIKVYTSFDCSGQPVAQGSAEELAAPGLTVTVPVALGVTTNFRATAETDGIVSPCSVPISYKQEAPAPPPGEGGGGTGGSGTGGGGATGTGGTGGMGGGNAGGGGHSGIAYVAPLARITFGPAAKTRQRRPSFRFVDSTGQPGTEFFCRVDKKHWSKCGSPTKVKRLAPGRHVFSLKAVNAVGTPGPRPIKRSFKVVGS
jgi:hypothetical protein